MKIKVMLVDDHQVFREGLRSLLEQQNDLQVVGDVETGRSAVDQALRLKPDVVIMDIAMPELNGIEATRQICAKAPDTKVVALSMHSDKRFIAGMLQAGALGYLLKANAFEEVVQAVRTVLTNKHYVSRDTADTIVRDYVTQITQATPERRAELSPREREVLQLLAEGFATKEVAERLHVSSNTVDTHRAHIMAKLNVNSFADLVKYAIREGLTSLE